MTDDSATKKSARPDTARHINVLVGEDELSWGDLLPHTSYGTDGDDGRHSEFLEAVYIGAIVDFRRGKDVPLAVAGQKVNSV
jgi:hypothetical protein